MLKRAFAILFFILLINTVYLVTLPSPTVFYMANALLHLVLGVALTVGAVWLYRKNAQVAWIGCLIVSAALGLALMYLGNTRPNFWLLIAHIVAGVLAVGISYGMW